MAFTVPIDSAVTGDIAPAALWNTFVRDNLMSTMHVLAYKSADETISSTTLQNDDALFFAVAANERWLIEASLMIDSNATAGFQATFTVPASATIKFGVLTPGSTSLWVYNSASTPAALMNAGATLGQGSPAAGNIWGTILRGIVQVAGTAGNVQLQWAQNAGPSGSTIVKANSCLIGARLN
jgi:hypothetical protein